MDESDRLALTEVPAMIDEAEGLAARFEKVAAGLKGADARGLDRELAEQASADARRLAFRLKDAADAMSPARLKLRGYGVAFTGPDEKMWFVHRCHSLGNVMRCNAAESAASWPTAKAAREWAEGLPNGTNKEPGTASHLDGLDLYAVKLRATAEVTGGPFRAGAKGG